MRYCVKVVRLLPHTFIKTLTLNITLKHFVHSITRLWGMSLFVIAIEKTKSVPKWKKGAKIRVKTYDTYNLLNL